VRIGVARRAACFKACEALLAALKVRSLGVCMTGAAFQLRVRALHLKAQPRVIKGRGVRNARERPTGVADEAQVAAMVLAVAHVAAFGGDGPGQRPVQSALGLNRLRRFRMAACARIDKTAVAVALCAALLAPQVGMLPVHLAELAGRRGFEIADDKPSDRGQGQQG
jgi:hypothetical protein